MVRAGIAQPSDPQLCSDWSIIAQADCSFSDARGGTLCTSSGEDEQMAELHLNSKGFSTVFWINEGPMYLTEHMNIRFNFI